MLMTKFIINWSKASSTHGIKEGSILRISKAKNEGGHISGAIYKNGFPVLAIFGSGNSAFVKVSRKGRSLKGTAILKIRAFDKFGKGTGIDDVFQIL